MARLTPMRAMRAKCLDCCGGSSSEVRRCEIAGCPLHEYRLGHRPKAVAGYEASEEAEGGAE